MLKEWILILFEKFFDRINRINRIFSFLYEILTHLKNVVNFAGKGFAIIIFELLGAFSNL